MVESEDKVADYGEDLATIHNKALELLARREHSQAELERKLQQKLSIPNNSTLIPIVLNRLCELGLLSDARFTEAYVNMRARRGYGPARIALELRERGVDSALADQYLSDRDDWAEILRAAWQKKFGAMPTGYAEKVKQMGFLRYRGFEGEAIRDFFEDQSMDC
jgi:regulatory protein